MSQRRSQEPVADIVLPITPMLDMAFQLLTFFIFTYHPTALEGQMALRLEGEGFGPGQVEPGEVLEPTMVIQVKPADQGGENPFVVEDGVIRTPLPDLAALNRHLREAFDRRKETVEREVKGLPPDRIEGARLVKLARFGIKVHPTSKVRWGEVVKVMDACRAVGFISVSFAKPIGFDL
jgi:hypothetical protein